MIYAYLRVSTNSQTTENQKITIKSYASLNNLQEPVFVYENVSGTKDYQKRKLGVLINNMNENDILIITELSRLGRSLTMIFNILSILLEKKYFCNFFKRRI